MKKVLIAMSAFKGSATSDEVEAWVEEAILEELPDVIVKKFPLNEDCAGAGTEKGINKKLDNQNFDAELSDANLVIVGEGRIDSLTYTGKCPVAVGKRVMNSEVPVIALVGCADKSIVMMKNYGVSRVFAIVNGRQPVAADLTKEATSRGLHRLASQVAKEFLQ